MSVLRFSRFLTGALRPVGAGHLMLALATDLKKVDGGETSGRESSVCFLKTEQA